MNKVVKIEDMEKNRDIEKRFDRYFDGAELPPCDLTEAKRVVSARARRRKRDIGTIISSICAVCGGIFIICFALLYHGHKGFLGGLLGGNDAPEGNAPGSYLLSETTSASQSFTELNGKYDVMKSFAPFSLSDNADAQYTLYFADDKEVLLRADLRYTDAFTAFRATVWCDLTQGEYTTQDFEEYRALLPEKGNYGSATQFVGGEYVSRACMMKGGTEYVIDMTSPNQEALDMLVSLLQK